MSEQLFSSSVNNVVPWQAVYSFPTQSTKMQRQTVKLPPKNGGTFGSADSKTIRIEFPSDGYMNALKSYLAFDFVGTPTYQALTGATLTLSTAITGTVSGANINAFAATRKWTLTKTGTSGYAGKLTTANCLAGAFVVFQQGSLRKQIYQIKEHDAPSYANTNDITVDNITWFEEPNVALPAVTAQAGSRAMLVTMYPGVRLQEGGIHELFREIATMYGGRDFTRIKEYSTLASALIKGGQSVQWRSSAATITDGSAISAPECDYDDPVFFNTACNDLVERLQFYYSATSTRPRRIALNLFDGVLNLRKLLALNWMAAQFAIELTLHDARHALQSTAVDKSAGFTLSNVEYVTELFYFDSVYDVGFLMGLKNEGIPMKYSSWNFHTFALTGSRVQMQIQDRARSVKYAIAVVRDSTPTDIEKDSNRFYYDAAAQYLVPGTGGSTTGAEQALWNAGHRTKQVRVQTGAAAAPLKSYQWRVGGKYYPAQPVNTKGGGVEAYMELLKLFDGMGDYTFGHVIQDQNWAGDVFPDTEVGGSNFMICMKFEHEDMADNISGINAEEQSDLCLEIEFDMPAQNKRCDIFVCYDALLILRDGNTVQKVM